MKTTEMFERRKKLLGEIKAKHLELKEIEEVLQKVCKHPKAEVGHGSFGSSSLCPDCGYSDDA